MIKWLTVAAILFLTLMLIVGLWWWPKKKCPEKFFERHGDLVGCDVLSLPNDISADGVRVAGFSSSDDTTSLTDCIDGTHKNEATGWTRKCPSGPPYWPGKPKGLIGLGYVPSPAQVSVAYGISPDGLVTVGLSDYNINMNLPAVFLPSGVKDLALPHPIGAARDVSIKGANEAPVTGDWGVDAPLMMGRVIVGWTSEGGNHPHRVAGAHAVYWNSWTNIVMLTIPAALPDGSRVISSEALCISDNAMTIGGTLYYNLHGEGSNYRSYPCVWRFSGSSYVPEVLKDLDGGDTNARITHISGDGQVLVGWGTIGVGDSTCYAYPKFACKWTFSSSTSTWSDPQALKPLSDFEFSSAAGTNFDGSVVVGSSYNYSPSGCPYPDFDSRATLWHGAANLDLTAMLKSMVPDSLRLWEAIRVSANGRIVTGYSFDPSFTQEGWTAGLK